MKREEEIVGLSQPVKLPAEFLASEGELGLRYMITYSGVNFDPGDDYVVKDLYYRDDQEALVGIYQHLRPNSAIFSIQFVVRKDYIEICVIYKHFVRKDETI